MCPCSPPSSPSSLSWGGLALGCGLPAMSCPFCMLHSKPGSPWESRSFLPCGRHHCSRLLCRPQSSGCGLAARAELRAAASARTLPACKARSAPARVGCRRHRGRWDSPGFVRPVRESSAGALKDTCWVGHWSRVSLSQLTARAVARPSRVLVESGVTGPWPCREAVALT